MDVSINTVLQQTEGWVARWTYRSRQVRKAVMLILSFVLTASVVVLVATILYLVDPKIASRGNLDSRQLVGHMHSLCMIGRHLPHRVGAIRQRDEKGD